MVDVSYDKIGKIIAAINPDKYYAYKTAGDLKEFKKLIEEDFWKAVEKAEVKTGDSLEGPEFHQLQYDSGTETLEPVYFWILGKLKDFGFINIDKLIDNFSSSPGSGHFAELGARATKMQEEAMKVMQTIGLLVKSLVNIVYDLREFEMRISQYDSAKSEDKNTKEAGILGLKQIWMDNVDIKRGRGSINMLAQDLQFVTIRDAFMIVNSLEEVKKIDLNDRVKRILEPRLQEFLKWKELSETEIRKRFEIEKSYLKSQINSLKLYTRWAKPYLRTASQLENRDLSKSPDLVTAFNTVILQLTLLAKLDYKYKEAAANKELPAFLKNKDLKRKYYSCILVTFMFRGIPQRFGQNYVFGGRVEVEFRAFALNEDELKMLNQKLEESDLNDGLKLAEGMTGEALEQMKSDIEYFLTSKEEKQKMEKESKSSGDINPFFALLGFGEKKDKEKKKKDKEEEKIKEVKSDSYIEGVVRKGAQITANQGCFNTWDVYKKGHDMASHPGPWLDWD
jgi:hypothetical protein